MSPSSSYVKHGKLTHAYSFSKRLPMGPTRSLRPFAAWVRKRVSVTRDPVRWHLPWGSRGGDQSGSGDHERPNTRSTRRSGDGPWAPATYALIWMVVGPRHQCLAPTSQPRL
ncbi:hypothetical protein BHM03_00026531 [Ensete ventricosum]|uniref:Uncharacterized protein n=1 Tax=Ensete ventricosum TaxID=4639 RepID=A0A445MH85_ENSVE|nr:hypothetical protein BHM03_00026531 [Ensete ventricosum]